ncbi:ATP-binding protein [Bacteroidota bacterium]
MEKQQIILINQLQEIKKILPFIKGIADISALEDLAINNFILVLEEAITNVIKYAFTDEEVHEIKLSFSKSNNVFSFVIEDDGIEFDSTKQEEPDVTLSAEERGIGGLGIFLIKQIMDEVNYKRENNKNILILSKKI